MAFKERIKRFGSKVKGFWKEHWGEVVAVTGGVAITGLTCYGMYKLEQNRTDRLLQEAADEAEKETKEYMNYLEEKTAWNKDWDAQALALEFATHQPLGPFREPGDDTDEDGYVDPLEGNSYIVAGPNSYYNDNPDTVEIYVLDNEGYFHHLPEDVHNA